MRGLSNLLQAAESNVNWGKPSCLASCLRRRDWISASGILRRLSNGGQVGCLTALRHRTWRGPSSRRNTSCLLLLPIRRRTPPFAFRSEEHTSELQSLMRISYAVFCLKKKITTKNKHLEHKTK